MTREIAARLSTVELCRAKLLELRHNLGDVGYLGCVEAGGEFDRCAAETEWGTYIEDEEFQPCPWVEPRGWDECASSEAGT